MRVRTFGSVGFQPAFLFIALGSLVLTAAAADSDADLSIVLKSDKSVYKPGDEITFSETLTNKSPQKLQIYDDTCFHGTHFGIERAGDRGKTFQTSCSSPHTVKPDMRPSRRIWIEPGKSYTRTVNALVTKNYEIAFQAHGGSAFTGYSPGGGREDLPAKYSGCGQIFALEKPGKYAVRSWYWNDLQWSNGEPLPKEPAWIGRANSQPITIEIKAVQ